MKAEISMSASRFNGKSIDVEALQEAVDVSKLKKRKFLIVTPSFSLNSGGAIALHKLCHLINENGREAYLFPYVDNLELNQFNYLQTLAVFFKKHLRQPLRRLKTHKIFNTPIYKNFTPKMASNDEWVIVYPEIIFGNPLRGKNIVRWLLNNPGYSSETGKKTNPIYFGRNEIYFRYGVWFKDFQFPGSHTSKNFLTIQHHPLDLYFEEEPPRQRTGTAYCLRKGSGRKITHDLSNAILIDGMKHHQIAEVFKTVKTFISYDTYTTYSQYAALCGCDSIVIPMEGVPIGDWMPQLEDRYGVAYGFDELDFARSTRHLLRDRYIEIEKRSVATTNSFMAEVDRFFSSEPDGSNG